MALFARTYFRYSFEIVIEEPAANGKNIAPLSSGPKGSKNKILLVCRHECCCLKYYDDVGQCRADPGPTAVYDTDTDITWMRNANANANAGAGSPFDDYANTNGGKMCWQSANAWAASLNINGVTGWRLPATTYPDVTCSSVLNRSIGGGCTGSEMGHLFNVEGIGRYIDGTYDDAPFSNIQRGFSDSLKWTPQCQQQYANKRIKCELMYER